MTAALGQLLAVCALVMALAAGIGACLRTLPARPPAPTASPPREPPAAQADR